MTLTLTPPPTLPDINDAATFNARSLALYEWIRDTFINELETLNAADYFDLQVDAYSTVEDVAKVGTFGLGTSGPASLTAASALDNVEETSFHRVLAADVATVNGPSGAGAGVVFTQAFNATFTVQTYHEVLASSSGCWRRVQSNGTWTAWMTNPSGSNLLGTVAFSGSDPVGDLFEVDSAGADMYHRDASGFTIAWTKALTLDFSSASECNKIWTYPIEFDAAPQLFMSPPDSTGATPVSNEVNNTFAQSVSTTSALIRAQRITGLTNFVSGDDVVVDCVALGWVT